MKKKLIMFSLAVMACACAAVGFSACGSGGGDDDSDNTVHNHTLSAVAETDATCTEAGNSAYWYCADCGKYFSDANATTEITQAQTVVEALGHDFETKFSWDYTNGVASASATGVCSRDSSHTENVTCTLEEDTSKTIAATCTTSGSVTYIATATYSDGSTDTSTRTFEVDPTGHDSEKVTHYAAVDATETKEGTIEYWYCSDCGKYYSDSALTNEITAADIVTPITAKVSMTTAAVESTDNEGNVTSTYYYASASLTVATTGVYKVELTTCASETLYVQYEVNGVYVRSYVDYATYDQLKVEKDDVVTFYAYDMSSATIAAETIVVTITRTGDETAVIPEALTIPGDTVATLDSTGRSYDLYYTATAETAGEYTFTLSGADLTDVTVYIYKDGSYSETLSAAATTTSLLVPEGSTINISASISSSATEAITFTVTTAIDTSAETRTGYYEADPITISSYSYDKDMTVEAGETLYYVIRGSGGTSGYSNLHVNLTVSSDDAAFTVYGYLITSSDTTGTYAELTATNGVYSFTLSGSSTREYIKIAASAAGTINVKVTESADELELTSYTLTTSNMKYVVQTDGEYVFTVASTERAIIRTDGGSVTIGADDEDYCVAVLTLTSGQAVYMASYLPAGCTVTVTQSSAINGATTGYALVTGDNEAAITSADAATGITVTYTATAAGTYTFTIDSSDAKVTVATATESTTLSSSDKTVSYTLGENEQVTVTFMTTGSAAVYGLNISCKEN